MQLSDSATFMCYHSFFAFNVANEHNYCYLFYTAVTDIPLYNF